MNDTTKSSLRWLIGLPIRLLAVLFLTGILVVILMVPLAGAPFHFRSVAADALPKLLLLVLLAGYTWAVYFGLPFFRKRARWQRVLISSVPALGLLFLTCWAAVAVMSAVLSGKSDQRVESVTLPSGEILENHTYCDNGGWPGGIRINQLFLKNPATGASERIDAHGNLDYDYGPSLLQRYPHPQEFIYGDEKVLVIGSYLCQRIIFNHVPSWKITFLDLDTEAQAYLKSFLPTNDIMSKSQNDIGWVFNNVPFLCDSLDLTNNILILKKQMPKGFDNWQQFQQAKKLFPFSLWDEFPHYLIYSSLGFNDDWLHRFPLKFDLTRTKAKNGPLWDNSAPPDSSSITIQSAKFGAKKKIADVTARVIELLHANSDGFIVNTNTLGCDPFPGRKKHLTIEYGFNGFDFASTNSNGDKVSNQTLINYARK